MIRRLIAFVAVAVIALVPCLWAETIRVAGDVTVLQQPIPSSPVVGTAGKGTVFQVLARTTGWVQVAYPIGNGAFYKGYVPAVLCEDAGGVGASEAVTVVPSSVPKTVPAAAPVAAPVVQQAAPLYEAAPVAPRHESAPRYEKPASVAEREGFWFGLGLGYGSQRGCDSEDGCGDRQGGLSGDIRLGGTLNENVLLGVESIGWVKDVEGATLTIGGLMGTVTIYPAPSTGFFLKGGGGWSYLRSSQGGLSYTKNGWGLIGGLGYDIRVARRISITPSVSYLYTNLGDIDLGYFGVAPGVHGDIIQFAVGVTFH